MTVQLRLKAKPFSINAASYRDKRFVSAECRAWQASVLKQLEPYQAQMKQLGGQFKADRHEFHVNIKIIYPEALFFTSSRAVSNATHDLSNVEKMLIDLIFLKRHGSKLAVDDRYITKLVSTKAPGPEHFITVKIQLLERANAKKEAEKKKSKKAA